MDYDMVLAKWPSQRIGHRCVFRPEIQLGICCILLRNRRSFQMWDPPTFQKPSYTYSITITMLGDYSVIVHNY